LLLLLKALRSPLVKAGGFVPMPNYSRHDKKVGSHV